MAFTPLSARFQSLLPLPTIKLGPSSADFRVGGLVHALDPCGSLQWPLLWGWEFLLLLLQPPWVFSIIVLRLYFPHGGALGCVVIFAPVPFLPVYICVNVGPQSLLAAAWPALFHNPPPHWVLHPQRCREFSLLHCPSLPLLQVWMNVSSLSPWLLDFHTVQVSVSSVCFLFLNCCCSSSFGCARRHSVSTYASILAGSPLFLSFFWLRKEAKCRYLCLHLCQKSICNGF